MTNLEVEPGLRDAAVKRLKKRRDFYSHLLLYVLVNGFLVVFWLMTSSPGFFWPIFPLFGWGVGLVMHAWDVFLSSEPSQADIDREVARMRR